MAERARSLPAPVAAQIARFLREHGAAEAHRWATSEISPAITMRQVRDLARRYGGGRICADCPTPVSDTCATGRCKPCAARVTRNNPEFERRRVAGLRRAFATPEYRAAKSAERIAYEASRKNDPEWQAYKRLSGKRLRADFDANPEAQAKTLAQRGRVGRMMSDRLLPWCPLERRAEYRALRRKVGRADARRIIEAEMTPFERMMAKAASGVRVIDKLDLRPAAPAYSLVGNATGML